MLILCPRILLKWMIGFYDFLNGILVVSTYKIISSSSRANVTSPFPNWMSFNYFPLLLLWLGHSVPCWTEVARVDILTLLLIIKPLSMIIAIGVSCMALTMLKKFPSICSFLRAFCNERVKLLVFHNWVWYHLWAFHMQLYFLKLFLFFLVYWTFLS